MTSKRLILLSLFIFLLTFTGSFFYFRHQFSSPTTDLEIEDLSSLKYDPAVELLPTPIPVDPSSKLWSLVLLGYGGAGHQGGYLTDVIQQIVVWPERKIVATIHIPRDILVEYPLGSGRYQKINSLFAIKTKPENYPRSQVTSTEASGGAQLVKAYVGMVTGITPQAYLGIDFNRFVKAIDSLGGITVDIKQGFTDPWYPVAGRELELCGHTPEAVTQMSATMSGFNLEKQFPCRYETLNFASGPKLLNGETALKYVRSRHSSSDFVRGQRQAEVLKASLNKLLSIHSTSRWPVVYDTIKKSVVTDIGDNLEAEWLASLPALGGYTQISVGISTQNGLTSQSQGGSSGLVPQSEDGSWTSIHQYIRSQTNPPASN